MALENLASKWGIKQDAEKFMQPRRRNYELRGKKVRLDSMIQTAKGHEDRLYTVVLVAAIMLFD